LVGNFSYFSFEMEVQDGAPRSLKDTVSHNSSWFYLAAPLRDNFNWSKIPQNLKVFKVGSARLYRTETHTIAWFKVFNLQLDPRKLTE
jgi:hypothetical protein